MEPGQITLLLHEWSAGEPAAAEKLFELVYPHLRQIAGSLFRGERPENLLQPTSMVNELFLKLVRQRSCRFEDREHFYSLSARLMRRLLVDQARSEHRVKRSGGVAVPLSDGLVWMETSPEATIDLDRILNELEEIDPRKCRMVELRFFLGFTAEETAEILQTSKATIDRDLRFIRVWLADRLQQK
jgi:RNA polymerase sigma factor (TIGR02999 family)